MKEEIKKTYKVTYVAKETPSVTTLELRATDGNPEYIPGQFINVYFEEFGKGEGKSYSISSASKDIAITVRNIGKFSNKLSNMKVGDILIGTLPYGYFYNEDHSRPIVMIAGGIGIAPFRSMIYNSLNIDSNKEIKLFYSNKSYDEIIFKKEFDILSRKFATFSVKYFITQQSGTNSNITNRRIEIKDIYISNNYDYFICGSIGFVRDFWTSIKKAGIDEMNIYTESFF